MQFTEFNLEMDRLKKVYGQVKYPEERLVSMFEKLSGLPISQFREQVTYFIADMDKAPMLRDFIGAFSSQMVDLKRQEIEKKLVGINSCFSCSDSGCEIFYKRESGMSYAFQCSCKRGYLLCPTYPKQYPGINSNFASHREWVSGKYQKARPNIAATAISGFTSVRENLQKL